MNEIHGSRGGNNVTKFIGLLLVLFGAFIIFDDYYPLYYDFWDFSPIILVAFGIKKILDNKKDFVFGALLLAVGVYFLANNFDFLPYFLEDNFFAFLLILVGIFIITQKTGMSGQDIEQVESEDFIKINAFFGSNERVIDTKTFLGGDCVAIFGSVDIDFRRAELGEGNQPLFINIIFGGATIYIPDDWNVIFESTTIFGSNEDNRKFRNEMEKDSQKNLVVKGLCIFGGFEIKS